MTQHHRYMLQRLLRHLRFLEAEIEDFDARIAEALAPFVSEEQFLRLDEIPGLNRRSIENVVAEIGSDMSRFPTDDHLCSWAGMSSGNEESAGKRKRQRTTHGNRWLRRALSEAAWAASPFHVGGVVTHDDAAVGNEVRIMNDAALVLPRPAIPSFTPRRPPRAA